MVALDRCYVAGTDEQPVFRPLSRLKSDEIADVLQIAKTRILKALTRLGAVDVMPDVLAVDDAWAARDPVMAHLAAAAVAGLPPAGPAERKRDPVRIVDGARPQIVGDLVVQDQGFNLHAKTRTPLRPIRHSHRKRWRRIHPRTSPCAPAPAAATSSGPRSCA